MADNPNLPLLEEVKINLDRHPDFKLTRSASEGTSPVQNLEVPEFGVTPGEDPGIDVRARTIGICNELIRMGFPQKAVFALLSYFPVADIQSAVDLLVKSEFGWTHTFVSEAGNEENCEICQERYKEHIEAAINQDMEEVVRPQKLSIFDIKNEKEVDTIRTEVMCKICMQGVPFAQDFHLSCGHMYCKSCVRSFLEININGGEVMELKCPEEGCDARFTKADIQKLCKKPLFDKYLKFRENLEVNQNKKLRWCPAPNCGRFLEKKSKAHVVCDCGFHMCFRCGEAWHPGVSCAKNYEKLYSKWASHKKIQLCPKCKIKIEKNEGCNHMTCGYCRYEWCWICGGKYSSSHYDSAFFGCPMLRFTSSDWSLCKIALFHFIMFLLSPFLCLYNAFTFVSRPLCDYLDEYYSCKCCLGIIVGLTIVIAVPLVTVVMMVPVILYRLYNVVHVAGRAFAN